MKQLLLKKASLILALCMCLGSFIYAQNPGLIISEIHINPAGTDSPFEYAEFKVTKRIDFSVNPYSVILCNNGIATSSGWISGGALSYGFSINTGTVNPGDVVYVGGSSMVPTGIKLRMINTGTTGGDQFGNAATGGVFGNGGASADGIAVFDANISTITNSTVPVDALFYGTSIGTATTTTGGYQLPINDIYNGGKLQTTSFLGSDPGASNLVASGIFDTITNTYISARTWNIAALTDGTSSVILSNAQPPSNLAFSVDNQTVIESIGTLTVNITIAASNSNPSSVEVAITPFGTATAGTDLAYTTQTVTFPSNATGTLPLTITINDDALPEAAEYFVIKLQNPVNATFTGITQQTIFIKDNENSTPVGNTEVSMTHVSSFSVATSNTVTGNSAEIVAHDPISQRLFVANSIGKKLDIIDFSNPSSMSIISSIDISTYGNINSVAVQNGIVACAIENTIPEQDGFVVFFNVNGVFQKQVTVGALPDMITFNHSGTKVLTANEGQPNTTYTIDPEGSVSIIDISSGIPSLSQSNVTTALFTSFNSQVASLKANGVRIYGPGSTVAQDMEPEYITVSEDDLTAYVVLQENNAFAYVDLTTNIITDIKPLGFKDHSVLGNALDATNTGSNVNIANWPLKGMYLPDAVSHFNVGGTEYLITANEGDARADYGAANNEETTIGAVTFSLDPTAFPYASVMKTNADLGKLKCTNRLGDTDNDGDFDEIYTFGGRSFSIWNAATGTLVYDSGDDLEQITANDPTYGALFNCSNTNITKKDRSDDKGPEPEGVAIATIAGNLYAFVSMERVGGLMVFNINNPAAPQFVQYVNNRGLTGLTGDRGPEGIIYVTQQNSPNGKALVVLGNEVSSTVSVYEIACPSVSVAAISTSSTACAGNTLSISSSTISGASYVWYNGSSPITGANSSVYNTTVSGNYSVKLNGVGCTVPSNSVSLTFNALPTISITASSQSICATQTATLQAAGAQTYSWTNGPTSANNIISPTSDLTYTVSGTDINGCSKTETITVIVNPTPTVVTTSSQPAICPNETVTITVSGALTYTWTDNSNNSSYTVSPITSATYSVTGTDANGCSDLEVINIIVNPTPTITVNAGSSSLCSGNSTTLTATGASSYTWVGGPNTSEYVIIIPSTNTTYTVNGTDLNNCNNTGIITISVNITPTVTVMSNTYTLCAGETASLTAGGASTYTWLPSGSTSANEMVTPNSNTTYSLIGSDNGCMGNTSVFINVNSLPVVSVSTSNTLICAGESAVLTASSSAASFVWSNGATTMTTSVSPNSTTVYTVTVNDGLCSSTETLTQNVSLCTSIEVFNNDSELSIYPNPFNSTFNIKWQQDFQTNQEVAVTIFNTLGEIIMIEKTLENTITVNALDWTNGTYFVKINNKVSKIIKQD